jgi:1-acyl-sn-glycerol-3-phosphate acyltransferase
MLSFLPGPIIGVLAALAFLINIALMALVIILLGLIKFCVPFRQGQYAIETLQYGMTNFWIDINSVLMLLFYKIKWDVKGQGEIVPNHWYFVIANHRSWVDILVLQKIFNRKIPMLKFFMKQELLWALPVGGLACWMLDFPFMKRYSKAQIKKNPGLRTADVETTKMACNKFKKRPTTIMSFLEGTRFTELKREERSSPYKNLLRPKAGGLGLVVNELQEYVSQVIDTTIVYNHPDPTFWNFLCGKVTHIHVFYKVVALNADLYGEYYTDSVFRKKFQAWVNERWLEKDVLISNTQTSDFERRIKQQSAIDISV